MQIFKSMLRMRSIISSHNNLHPAASYHRSQIITLPSPCYTSSAKLGYKRFAEKQVVSVSSMSVSSSGSRCRSSCLSSHRPRPASSSIPSPGHPLAAHPFINSQSSLSSQHQEVTQQQQHGHQHGRSSRRPVNASAAAGSLPFRSDDSEETGLQGGNAAVPPATFDAPAAHKQDLGKMLSLAGPLMLQNVFGYLLSIVCTVAIGRLGAPELAASSLANSIYVVTGLSMVLGLSTAMETLCGQAYGARDYKALGSVLQRAVLVCWAACIPVAILWSQSTALMVAFGQDPAIAAMAGGYLVLCIPCLFLNIAQDCMKRYLLAQSVVAPAVYSAVAATLMAPLYFYTCVYAMGLGINGAAYAFILSQATGTFGLLGYIVWHTKKNSGSPTATWGGFSAAAAFSNWGQYLKYGIPAMLMISLEWWVFEIAVLMNGWLPNAAAALSVGGIIITLNTWCYMIPMGLGSAINTCVGNALGAGDGQAARRFAIVGLAFGLVVEAVMVAGVASFGEHLIHIIAIDPSVVDLALKSLPVLCFLMFWDGLNAMLSGVLRGSGQQKIGAFINGGCFLLAIPASYYLAFMADWTMFAGLPLIGSMEPVARVWLGVSTGALVQFLAISTIIARWDWDAQAIRVVKGITAGVKK